MSINTLIPTAGLAENIIAMNISTNQVLKTKLSESELILNHVNLALKCLQLYPANHATTGAAIDKLWLKISDYFQKYGHLAFMVTRDGLLIDGQAVGTSSPSVRSLASQLYRLKLDQILIQAAIDRYQLVELLMVVCMDPDDVTKAGGVRELLWQKRVSAVTVFQASLKLSHEFVPGSLDANTEVDDQAKIAAVQQALLSKDDITELERQLIKGQLEQSTQQLAGWLQTLGGSYELIDQATAILKCALPKIDSLIRRELGDEQVFLYRNLAEALLALEQPLKTELATMLIASSGDQTAVAAHNLIEQLTGEELSELFNLALNTNSLLQTNFLEFLENMPIKTERLRDLVPFLKHKVSLDDETVQRLIEANTTRAKATAKKAIPVEGADAAKVAALAMDLDQAALEKVEKEISDMNETLIEKGALAALGEVIAIETNSARFTRGSHAVQRILVNSFEQFRLGVAADALSIIINEAAKRRDEPDIFSILKEITRDAGQTDKVDHLLSGLENDSGISIAEVIHYLTLLDNPGILTLLDMLALEKRQSRRRLICQLLMASSKANIASLGNKIMDHRWYLVRNVVLILGQIGDENAVIYLQKAASHPDPRVRIEVAKSLANIGASAMPVIIDLLHDKDLTIKLEAIKTISKIRHPDAADILIGLIKQPDPFKRRVDIKVESISALGLLKIERSLPYLRKIAKSRSRLFRAQQARLSESARTALAKIQGGVNAG